MKTTNKFNKLGNTIIKEGDVIIFDDVEDVILTLGETEVELEEEGWVNKSEIKLKRVK